MNRRKSTTVVGGFKLLFEQQSANPLRGAAGQKEQQL
jgi:hypothetical protein